MNRTHTTIVNQGVDFIVDHLFEKLSVEKIADHCCFSRYYFNRLFKSVTGESIYRFIKRLRIESAAFRLIKFPHMSITDIACELGYSSSNFSVLFKEHYGISPSRFRADPPVPVDSESRPVLDRIRELQRNRPEKLLKKMDRQILFKTFDDMKLVSRRFKGNYKDLGTQWQRFCDEMEAALPDSCLKFYGISYDDPLIADEDKCLYDLCAHLPRPAGFPEGNTRKIKGGRYLVYRFEGPIPEIGRAYNDLFGVWMPHRGHIMGPGLCLERYYKASVPGNYADMALYVPVL